MEKTLDEVLVDIFKVRPLPNNLKQPKRSFEKNELGVKSKIRIVNEFSEFEVKIVCIPKNESLI